MEEQVIELESESRIDVCVECCVRDRDFSLKKVYRCELCERWFCERHIEPRLAFIKDLKAIENSPTVRALYYTEMKREDGHPDFAYTQTKFLEFDIEEKNRNELIKQALDRMNNYYDDVEEVAELKPVNVEEPKLQVKTTEKKPKKGMVSEGSLHFIRAETEPLKKKHFHINVTGLAISITVFLAGLGLFLYLRDIYLIFIIPFIPFPISFWVIGIGLMIFGALGLAASMF